MYRIQNQYFIVEGKRDEALAVRKWACEVRVKIGLTQGQVFTCPSPSPDSPDFVWQTDLPSLEAVEHDFAAREASEEFARVRAAMKPFLRKFVVLRLQEEAL
jgi:hypothetical protein